MKKVLLVLATFSLVAMTLPAMPAATGVKANIPFDFMVGAEKLPAGHYLIERQTSPASIIIANLETGARVMVHTSPVQLDGRESTTLVFHKYGDQAFLSQIKSPGWGVGQELPRTKLERELSAKAKAELVVAGAYGR